MAPTIMRGAYADVLVHGNLSRPHAQEFVRAVRAAVDPAGVRGLGCKSSTRVLVYNTYNHCVY